MENILITSSFCVERLIGSGSYGDVYLCRSCVENQKYAAKLTCFGTDLRERWLAENESEILSDLSEEPHDNLVHLYTTIREPSQIILLMEYVSDITLMEGVLRWPLLTEMNIMMIMKQLLSALQHCHERTIVHRDIRPDNILWTHLPGQNHCYPSLKLIDFNLSRKVPEAKKFLTSEPEGDVKYMSPECLREGSITTFACDIWSVGVILYTLFAGYPPFFDYNYDHLVLNIVEGNFSLPQKFWNHVGERGKDILMKMLHIDYKERWSANELLQHDWLINCNYESRPPWPAHARLKEFYTYLEKQMSSGHRRKFMLTSQPRTSFEPSPLMINTVT